MFGSDSSDLTINFNPSPARPWTLGKCSHLRTSSKTFYSGSSCALFGNDTVHGVVIMSEEETRFYPSLLHDQPYQKTGIGLYSVQRGPYMQ